MLRRNHPQLERLRGKLVSRAGRPGRAVGSRLEQSSVMRGCVGSKVVMPPTQSSEDGAALRESETSFARNPSTRDHGSI